MKKSLVAAAIGAGVGFLVAMILFWAGPSVIEWIKGPPRLQTDAWVFYLVVVCGMGFGATAGAVVGAAAAFVSAMRTRGG